MRAPMGIEVYVARLRAKRALAGIRIRPVGGFGYMLLESREPAEASAAR